MVIIIIIMCICIMMLPTLELLAADDGRARAGERKQSERANKTTFSQPMCLLKRDEIVWRKRKRTEWERIEEEGSGLLASWLAGRPVRSSVIENF